MIRFFCCRTLLASCSELAEAVVEECLATASDATPGVVREMSDPTAPALGSEAPKTTLGTRARTIAARR